MFIFWIFFIIGSIYLLNNGGEFNDLFNRGNSRNYAHNKKKDSVEIIKKRYAKGEISKDEYKEMLNNIKY